LPDSLPLRLFPNKKFRLRIGQIDQRHGGFHAGAEAKLRVDNFAIDHVDAGGRRHVGDINLTRFAAEAKGLDLLGNTEKISQFDGIPA